MSDTLSHQHETATPPVPAATGAEVLLRTAHAGGIDICFANPGTTEMPLVQALDVVTGVRPVLGLFEGVCTGAADGYARIAGRPASTLLHLGPGLANGIANLHNARRARSPMLNLVGDHASWHLPYDAPLTSDIDSLASPVSGWVGTIAGPDSVATDTVTALDATRRFPRSPATLVVPLDFQQMPADAGPLPPREGPARPVVPGERIEATARRLRDGRRVVFLLGDDALGEQGQSAVAAIAAHTEAAVYSETFPAVAERGQGLPDLDRLPYFPERAQAVLRDADIVVLAGALEPVSYFGYEGIPAELAPTGACWVLSEPGENSQRALIDLAAAVGAPPVRVARRAAAGRPSGSLTPAAVGAVVTQQLPEGAIVSVEGGTCGYPFFTASRAAARHTTLTNTGGAIGQGLPVALGAALAAPDRPVIALQSDGSAHYTVQALWTMAREQLPITVLITSNHRYGVLQTELDRLGASHEGRASHALTSLTDPAVDWMALAAGYGVPGRTVDTAEELTHELSAVGSEPGPRLVAMRL